MIIPKIGQPELQFLCSAHSPTVLKVLRNFMKKFYTVFNLLSGHKYKIEMAMFNVQRAITSKVGRPDLLFISSARLLMEL